MKSKGLCFICGERWAKDHRCKQEVQLHVVQEMLEYVQNMPAETSDTEAESTGEVNAICISVAALGDPSVPAIATMKLKVQLQGHKLTLLVDSGSTHSFLDCVVTAQIKGVSYMPVKMVKVANGNLVPCSQQLLSGSWSTDGHKFTSDFKIFPLGSYNGILGLDWLATHSPMQVDWAEHWLSFDLNGITVTLLAR